MAKEIDDVINEARANDARNMTDELISSLHDPYVYQSLNGIFALLKSHYDSAIANGFTENQAIQLILTYYLKLMDFKG